MENQEPNQELNLLATAKQTLSIISTSTAKDSEIQMLIDAGKQDMKRQGIIVDDNPNELVVATIMMFVKGHFGNVELKDKELAQKTYKLLCTNLSLSQSYIGEE